MAQVASREIGVYIADNETTKAAPLGDDTARGVGNAFSLLDEARVGERASRWAALAFAVIVAVYALGFFSASPNETPLYFALWGATTAFLGTYMLGIVSAVASSFVITSIRRREGAG